jgi:hypothetical protein
LRPPPDLIVETVLPQPAGLGGEPFSVKWTVKNIGQAETQQSEWWTRFA